MSVSTFEEITKTRPEKRLTLSFKKHAGRNNQGKLLNVQKNLFLNFKSRKNFMKNFKNLGKIINKFKVVVTKNKKWRI